MYWKQLAIFTKSICMYFVTFIHKLLNVHLRTASGLWTSLHLCVDFWDSRNVPQSTKEFFLTRNYLWPIRCLPPFSQSLESICSQSNVVPPFSQSTRMHPTCPTVCSTANVSWLIQCGEYFMHMLDNNMACCQVNCTNRPSKKHCSSFLGKWDSGIVLEYC